MFVCVRVCVCGGGGGRGEGEFVCVYVGVDVGRSMWVSSLLATFYTTNPCRVFTNQFLGSKTPRVQSSIPENIIYQYYDISYDMGVTLYYVSHPTCEP